MTYRPENICHSCNYEWHPRGHDLSRKCPSCGSTHVEQVVYETPPKQPLTAFDVFANVMSVVIGVGFVGWMVGAGVSHYQAQNPPPTPEETARMERALTAGERRQWCLATLKEQIGEWPIGEMTNECENNLKWNETTGEWERTLPFNWVRNDLRMWVRG